MRRRGASLIEALLSMCLLAVATLAGLEAFSAGRKIFFKMDATEERETRAAAGLDRACLDAREAGLGLGPAIGLGLVEGITAGEAGFAVAGLEREAEPGDALAAGDAFIPLADSSGFAPGRTVCLLAADGGETRIVSSVLQDGLILSVPLGRGFPAGEARLLLVRTVEIFLDQEDAVLRRRINGGSAQPLIEGALAFSCRLDAGARTIAMELRLESEEAVYAATVLGKNLWLGESYGDDAE
jgi:hypothetical protein